MEVVKLLKSKVTEEKIKILLSGAGAKGLHKVDNSIRCSCPLHGGKNTTSFKYDLEDNLWVCFSGECGGGDIFTLIAQLNDLSMDHDFVEVIHLTADFLGVDISTMQIDDIRSQLEKERSKWIQYMNGRLNKKINAPYDIHNLGELYRLNEYAGFKQETLEKYKIYYSKHYNRISFSLFDKEGNIVGASLRRCDEKDRIKWLHRPKSISTGQLLYNLHNIPDEYDTVFVVEGIKDLLRLVELGIENVVCTLGLNITTEQMVLLSNFTKVVLCYDNDNGGKIGTLKAILNIRHMFDLYVCDLADININDPYELKGAEDFNSLKQYRWFEYLKKYNLKLGDLKTIIRGK